MNRELFNSIEKCGGGTGRTNRFASFLPHEIFTAPRASRPTARFLRCDTFVVLVGCRMLRNEKPLLLVLLNTSLGWVEEDAITVHRLEVRL